MAPLPIDHVVVLMLENRSFDHLLGFLDHPDPAFERLTPGRYDNPVDPSDPASARVGVDDRGAYTMAVDPPHSHQSVMEALHLPARGRPRMDGFVAAHARKARGEEPRPVVHWWRLEGLLVAVALVVGDAVGRLARAGRRAGLATLVALVGGGSFGLWRLKRAVDHVEPGPGGPEVMQCLAPDRVPVLATLARSFAVCTRWHCSVPGETWPNRNFVHAATSEEAVDIEVGFYEAPTVFGLLEEHGADWRVYHDGRAHLWAFRDLWRSDRIGRWHPIASFADHVADGRLAAYSFLEPDHEGDGSGSQHPGNNPPGGGGADFLRGEALIAEVYEALRRHPDVFARTMLLITYDEHGGFFDHVPPPTDAAAPGPIGARVSPTRRLFAFFVERRRAHFRFRVLGPRVPAVVVSPLIPAGTVDDGVYDHSSVVATLRRLFAPSAPPLTRRDAAARTFDRLATLSTPRSGADLPPVQPLPLPPPAAAPRATVAEAGDGDFARQLASLGGQVGAELARQERGTAARAPEAAAPAEGGPSPAGQVDRFRAAAARARGRG